MGEPVAVRSRKVLVVLVSLHLFLGWSPQGVILASTIRVTVYVFADPLDYTRFIGSKPKRMPWGSPIKRLEQNADDGGVYRTDAVRGMLKMLGRGSQGSDYIGV